METPKSRKRNDGETTPLRDLMDPTKESTPKLKPNRTRLNGLLIEYSPNSFLSTQDCLEVGWGDDSPINHKPESRYLLFNERQNSPSPRERLSGFTIPKRQSPDVTKYLLEFQKMVKASNSINNNEEIQDTGQKEKNNMDSFLKDDDSLNECLINCTQQIESELQPERERNIQANVHINLNQNKFKSKQVKPNGQYFVNSRVGTRSLVCSGNSLGLQAKSNKSIQSDNERSKLALQSEKLKSNNQSNVRTKSSVQRNDVRSKVTNQNNNIRLTETLQSNVLPKPVSNGLESKNNSKYSHLKQQNTDSDSSSRSSHSKSGDIYLFTDEDDIWLSQINVDDVLETPKKTKFSKHNSELNLKSTERKLIQDSNFRRSISFDNSSHPQPPKRQKSEFFKCNADEIESKRQEALKRKQMAEAERKKEMKLKYVKGKIKH